MTPGHPRTTLAGASWPAARPLSILLLADDQKGHAQTIHEHIRALVDHSRHDVRLFNPRGLTRSRFLDLSRFDVVIVHYSLIVTSDAYLAPWFREQIAAFAGLKVQFIQDEYRWVDEITAMLRFLGVDVLYSVVPEDTIPLVYGDRLPDTAIVPTLTGYISDDLGRAARAAPAPRARPIDVGYRGRSIPFWLGRLGHEKTEIGRGFLRAAQHLDLRCDIAWTERSRIYGRGWTRFVASCRATLASESGASIVDYDGAAEQAVRRYLAAHPLAEYDEVERAVLGPWLGGPAIKAISPRVFEAAALRTALVMFPGEYSGVVRPDEHYLPLERDFSNVEEIADKLKDPALVEGLLDRAQADLVESGRFSYRAFVSEFDDLVEARAEPRTRARPPRRAALRVEEFAVGRSYVTSSLYGAARRSAVVAVAGRHVLRTRPLRRLARAALMRRVEAPLWDDIFRLGLLVARRSGTLSSESETFETVPSYEDGRLVLTSVPEGKAPYCDVRVRVAQAIESGELRTVVWNHSPVGQYLSLPLWPTKRCIHLDVGHYDSYGVYRFDGFARIVGSRPGLAAEVLAPLLVSSRQARRTHVMPTELENGSHRQATEGGP